jgi:hypothetical protein
MRLVSAVEQCSNTATTHLLGRSTTFAQVEELLTIFQSSRDLSARAALTGGQHVMLEESLASG